jgi:SPP1 family predicted phage head-tail adaptor
MDLGKLRDRVTVTQPTTVADTLGGQSTTWATLGTFWAWWRGLTGREAMQGQAVQSVVSHKLVMRYRSDLVPTMRVKRLPDGPTCDVVAVRDPDGRKRFLELDLVEVR